MDFDNENLIMLVQGFSCLYNPIPKYKEYNSRQARDEAWENICKSIFGESWEELSLKEKRCFGGKVQKRWKCLKDAYLRSLKTRVEKRVIGGKSGRPYVYEQQMSFLKQSLRPKSASGSLDVDPSDAEEIIVKIDPGESDRLLEQSNSASSSPSPPAKRRRARTTEREDIPHRSTSSSFLPVQPFTIPPLQYGEEDKMFLLSLLPSMQDMSTVEKIDFKIKVMSLLKYNLESREKKLF